jgi:hypothetical protein
MPNIFYKIIIGVLFMACLNSCAKLPVQSVSLMQQIKDEGQRMHKINIAYINMLFENKNAEVDSFMNKEYIPEFISRIKQGMDANDTKIDMNKQWPQIFPKIVPVVNGVRDSLRTALAENRNKIISKLNEDYEFYRQACDAQIALLSSATKLNNNTRQIFNTLVTKVSGNKADLTQLEKKLDGFLQKGESISQKILFLNQAVQSIAGN